MTAIPGYTDRLCPTCGTITQHRIMTRGQRWRCLDCDHVTVKDLLPRLKPGRPPLGDARARQITIKVPPAVLRLFREEATRRGMRYQTLINDTLAAAAHRWRERP